METRIRVCRPEDLEDMRHICAETDPYFAPKQWAVLWTLYCDYYVQQEPENCFVVADARDKAVGYVLIAANWEHYKKLYKAIYMPKLEQLDRPAWRKKRKDLYSLWRIRQSYPAHLHINILPAYQGRHLGPQLLDAALDNLRQSGVRGIMLGVGSDNPGAERFYRRYGFTQLKKESWGFQLGLRL